MKNIKIIYDEGISPLLTKLNKKKLSINKVNNEEMEVEINNEKEYISFLDVIKKYLIKEKFVKTTNSILKKRGYSNSDIKFMLASDSLKNIEQVDYFCIITEILLMEYFKNLDTINLTAFMNLNMNGFNEEVKYIVEIAEKYINGEPQADEDEYEYEDNVDNCNSEGVELSIDDISTALLTLIENREIDINNFSEIKISVLKNNVIEIIDKEGFKYKTNNIGKKIGIKINAIETSLFLASIIISMMKTNKIVVSKNSKNLKDILTVYLNTMGITAEVVDE